MTWGSEVVGAKWYGEVIFTIGDGDVDYNHAFSVDPTPPNVMELLPEGAEFIEAHVHRIPR